MHKACLDTAYGCNFGTVQAGLRQFNYGMYEMSASNMHKLQSAQNSLIRVVLPSFRRLSPVSDDLVTFIGFQLITEYSLKLLHLPIRP